MNLNITQRHLLKISKSDRLSKYYRRFIIRSMALRFRMTTQMAVPLVQKVVISAGVGKCKSDANATKELFNWIFKIANQKPRITRAVKSVANFKIKEGDIVGLAVTIRKRRMYEFMDCFVNASLPRIRDFRGIPTGSIDSRGNLNVGVPDVNIFMELTDIRNERENGLNVCVVTSSWKRYLVEWLLKSIGFPFKRASG